ncbi:cyclic nucleotide phosphodiesterase [Echinococcus multilocularis]|uniref:Cyclic nucleotide phosphodiesterase n=1 Tax=Echinococcus multilocularis TaxID=6211 RepID=A0A087VYP8_ECHMU|nr:cyclic nucleotide phosphodiesterase [Echinococcus multilocularis]
MQNNYSSYTPRVIPQNNPGAGFYPTATPPDLRFYDWQYGPSMRGNKSNWCLPADFQRPPCHTSSGTRSSGVSHPVNYPNFNVLSCGDYPNPQLDRDYRQAFGREFEQSYVEQQTPRNSDQGTYYSQSYNERLSNSHHHYDFHDSSVRSSSWEHPIHYTGPPQDQDWRISQTALEPQVFSWGSGMSSYNYGYRQGDRCQNDRERYGNQSQYRERSRSPPTGRDLGYNQEFWYHPGGNECPFSLGCISSTYQTSSSMSSQRPLFAVAQSTSSQRIASETLLMNPGRKTRPPKILVILRGLPGSGKSTLAKLIKEKEAKAAEDEGRSAAVRVLSIDDFFVNEEGRFVYEAEMEEVYRKQLVKLLSRQIENGLFNFLLVDAVNRSAAELEELAVQARSRHFQVYVIEVSTSLTICLSRSAGRRSESDVRAIFAGWEPTPSRYTIIDANSLQQEITAEEVDMEADSGTEDGTSPQSSPAPPPSASEVCGEGLNKVGNGKGGSDDDEDEDTSRGAWGLTKSKWDDDVSFQRLERLDGLRRKLYHSNSSSTLSMAEYLKDEASQFRRRKEGVKRVTWADIEALRENSRMRELGFVVGQTDWNRMAEENDAKIASQALTRTKYF